MTTQDVLDKEEEFHDDWAASINIDEVMVDEFFEACTAPENRIIVKKLGDLTGKKLLELGCGAGEASVYFAKHGADVMATDISNGMLEVVQKVAAKHGTSLQTQQCYADKIPFEDGTFDVVYAANLLHHVDIDETLAEASRVLKKGGVFVSWDPLDHNPAINIYRKKAMGVRTEDEHPIKMREIALFKKHFSYVEYETTWFFTLWIFVKYYFVDKIDPNKERYWKKILVDAKKLEKTHTRLEKLDRGFLRVLPFMKRYCWNIVFYCKK